MKRVGGIEIKRLRVQKPANSERLEISVIRKGQHITVSILNANCFISSGILILRIWS